MLLSAIGEEGWLASRSIPSRIRIRRGQQCIPNEALFSWTTLSDLSPDMLTISWMLNPECEHLEGNTRTLRLDHTFDVVFIHDAIDCMLTLDDLRRALKTAALHCNSEGPGLFVPDDVHETFEPTTDHGGTDGDGRSLRYREWIYDMDPRDNTCVTE